MRGLLYFILAGIAFSQTPFQNLEGAVGYIVIERNKRVENYVVIQGQDGSVKTIRVDKNPSQFLKKTEESEGRIVR